MNCEKVHNDLILFIEGKLDEKTHEAIEKHLDHCHECSEFARMLKGSLDIIDKEKVIPENKGFADTVIARMNSKKDKTGELRSFIRYVAAAAVIVMGVITGLNIARVAGDAASEAAGGVSDEVYYLNDMYQEPIESFFLLKYREDE